MWMPPSWSPSKRGFIAKRAQDPVMAQSFAFVGQINPELQNANLNSSALQAILIPIVTLSVANPAANNPSPPLKRASSSAFSAISPRPRRPSRPSALSRTSRSCYLATGFFFPIGGIITGAWAVMFIGVIEWGAVGRMGFRENYRRRLARADRGGEKTIQGNDNDGMHGIMLDSLITPTRHSLDNSTAESQGGDKRLRVGGSFARRASDESGRRQEASRRRIFYQEGV